MLKNTALTIFLTLSLCRFTRAASFDGPAGSALERAVAGSLPAAPAAVRPAAGKDWTVMIFMNGKNNLEKYALKNVNQMETAGSSDRVNIVVELGRKSGTNRYLIRRDASTEAITSPAVAALGEANMGDPKHLAEFGKWAKAAYPAAHYLLIVWDHGTGWVRGPAAPEPEKGISYDDVTKDHITTKQLDLALKEIGKVDIYASDACLMQMAEVAYEIRSSMDFIIGSEQTIPGDGYPYDAWLSALNARPEMTPEELGRNILASYADYYDKRQMGASLSLLRTAPIEKFAALADDWAGAARAAAEAPVMKNARDTAQSYTNADNKDLADLVRLASESSRSAAVAEKGRALVNFINAELVAGIARAGGVGPATRGVSVYLPDGSFFNNDYDSLAWSKATRWSALARWAQTLK